MNGIAGIVMLNGSPTDATLERMIASTPHIVREDAGVWRSGPVGLLRFPYATTPEAVGEVQPWRHPDTGDMICFDGRIDNRPELLSLLGRNPGSPEPDCAIVLALFVRFGDDFLERLTGDYALAIWSDAQRRLLCARCPMGWRTLLWTQDATRFAFASQPRTLVDGLALERRLNEGAVGEYLSARFVSQTDTFWQSVNRLPNGSALALEDGRVRTWHWHKGPFEDWSGQSEAEHVERFSALFDEALVRSTRSNGPVVAHLSGGLDSSSVLCRAAELHAAGRIDRMPDALTVRYEGGAQDEREWAEAVERHLGISATIVPPHRLSFDEQRAWCAETLHLPLRPNVTTASVAPMQALGARVLLTGEGGDDWLRGTNGHWPDMVLRGQWPKLLREATAGRPLTRMPGAIRGMLTGGLGPIVSKRLRERTLRPHLDFGYEPPEWIRPEWARRIGLAERWRADALPVDLPSYAQRQRYQVYAFGRRHVNWDSTLAYVGSKGIELRHPLHNLRLTEFLMGASGGVLLKGAQKKHLLREAMRGTLPEAVRVREGKANMVAAIADAVSERFRERRPEDLLAVKMGWVDGRMLADSHAENAAWCAAGCPRDRLPKMHYGPVWFTIAVDLWLEHAFKI
jgi:asparagine synthase (glutamine-hydrolysing)